MKLWQVKEWSIAHKSLIVIALGFFLLLVLWFAGINVIGKVSNWWYSKGTEAAHEEINKVKGEAAAAKLEAAQAKQVATDAVAAFQEEKKKREVIQAEREALEKVLQDTRVTTNAKLDEFKKILAQPVTASSSDTSDEELCKRAAAIGIPCAP